MQKESEADTMVITTSRWHMTQEQLAQLRAANARLVTDKNIIEIRMARILESVERHAYGLLGEIGKTADDVISWHIRQSEKQKK